LTKSYSAKWLGHFKAHADAARDSVKEVTKVGAALIGPNNEVLLTAFNGPAIGVKDTPDRRSRTNGLKYKYSSHAERNLISFAARRGINTEGLTVYATHFPCSGCANALVQAGIKCVIVGYGEYKSSDGDLEHAKRILQECYVEIIDHKGSELYDRADALARAVLLDKYDKMGESLYYHSVRCARLVPDQFPMDYKIVAVLHDVVEHGFPIEALYSMFGKKITDSVAWCSRNPQNTYEQYIGNLISSGDAMALVAKLADNRDNLDPARAWEIEDQMRSLYRDRYIPTRQLLLNACTEPVYRDQFKIWGVDTLYSSSHKVFNQRMDLPYVLTRKD
jgi:dCMP deaminase